MGASISYPVTAFLVCSYDREKGTSHLAPSRYQGGARPHKTTFSHRNSAYRCGISLAGSRQVHPNADLGMRLAL